MPSKEEQLAVEGFEFFHGKDSEKITRDRIDWPPPEELMIPEGDELWEDVFPEDYASLPKWVSALGELVMLEYEDAETLEDEVIEFKRPYPLLCSDFMMKGEGSERLFIVGGKYRVHVWDDFICGPLNWVSYLTVKSFEDFEPTVFKHKFNAEPAAPTLCHNYDGNCLYILRGESEFYIARDGDVSGGIAG